MKIAALVILLAAFAFEMLLLLLQQRSADAPIPENVSDVYDAQTYRKWKAYHAQKLRLETVTKCLMFVMTFILYAVNAFAWAASFSKSIYVSSWLAVLLPTLLGLVISVPAEYFDTMVIEEKYGFNRTGKKTFFADQFKQLLIGLILTLGLVSLFIWLHRSMGDMVLVLFSVLMFAVVMFITFLYPWLSRIFNKFEPLPEGELRTRLTALMNRYGYSVREIQVMDASRRSSKSNAYFTGFGKMKTIVLYDTLVENFTDDEIIAVFAHEMGHGLHKDTIKNQALSFLNIAIMAVLLWLNVREEGICRAFGFEGVNYGFAWLLLSDVEMALLGPVIGFLRSFHSRRAEYRADAQAVHENCGAALVAALKKLARENFANLSPSPLVVRLTYLHPTLSQRITAIENTQSKAEERQE